MTSTLRRRGLGWVALASIVGLVACGGGSSQDPGYISVQTDVAVADVDGGAGRRRLVLLPQDAARRGQFLPAVDLQLPGAGVAVAAGDVDGDGRSDLFVHLYFEPSGYAPNTGLAVLLQHPGGGFGAATVLARQSGLNTQRIAATSTATGATTWRYSAPMAW